MGDKQENFTYFKNRHLDIYAAYAEFGRTLHENGGPLDEKQRWLIKIAVSAASGHELALLTHIRKAKDAGCTRDEIEHAVLLTATTVGFPTMMTALMTMREELGE
jgi:4-carboxymuconolactone decarboxylase